MKVPITLSFTAIAGEIFVHSLLTGLNHHKTAQIVHRLESMGVHCRSQIFILSKKVQFVDDFPVAILVLPADHKLQF